MGADAGGEHAAQAGAQRSQERERDAEAPARVRRAAGNNVTLNIYHFHLLSFHHLSQFCSMHVKIGN